MTTDILFPGGLARVDSELVWGKLQSWLRADTSRRCSVYRDSISYCCRLTWDTVRKDQSDGTHARSDLGIADAVANALQASMALESLM